MFYNLGDGLLYRICYSTHNISWIPNLLCPLVPFSCCLSWFLLSGILFFTCLLKMPTYLRPELNVKPSGEPFPIMSSELKSLFKRYISLQYLIMFSYNYLSLSLLGCELFEVNLSYLYGPVVWSAYLPFNDSAFLLKRTYKPDFFHTCQW